MGFILFILVWILFLPLTTLNIIVVLWVNRNNYNFFENEDINLDIY
jgi:hypothetical protein